MTDMKHMEYLESVVAEDVRTLREKEATYQGSWKRAGGRSAWFMLRRNMDRLLEMMRKPDDVHGFSIEDLDDAIEQAREKDADTNIDWSIIQYLRDCYVSENVFAKIRERPNGADGTVLAVMRDLRRYCMLVEAEMMARGVVKIGQVERRGGSTTLNLLPWLVTSQYVRDNRVREWLYDEWHPERRALTPAMTEPQHFELTMIATDTTALPETQRFYSQVMSLYERVGNWWILRIDDAPSSARDAWSYFAYEQNHREWTDLEPWAKSLYDWINSDNKYRMKRQHVAWSREP